MSAVWSAFAVELALITYRATSLNSGKRSTNPVPPLPVPAEYFGAFVVFGLLGSVPGRAQVPAAVFAWGLVVATALNFYTKDGAPKFTQAPLSFIAPGSPAAVSKGN